MRITDIHKLALSLILAFALAACVQIVAVKDNSSSTVTPAVLASAGFNDEYTLPTVISGSNVPDADFYTREMFKSAPNIQLIREYYSRSGEDLLEPTSLANNLAYSNGKTKLQKFAGVYASEKDAFVRRDALAPFLAEARRVLLSGKKTAAIAFWRSVYVKPYNFEKKEHVLCFNTDFECAPVSGNSLEYTFGTKDFRLKVLQVPPSFALSTNEAIAREIEHGVEMQTPRGMNVLIVVNLDDKAKNGQVTGHIAAVNIYRRKGFAENQGIPSAMDLLTTVTFPNPELSNGDVQTPNVALATNANGQNIADPKKDLGTLLFMKTKGKSELINLLTQDDKTSIARLLPFSISAGGKLVDNSCREPVSAETTVLALNEVGAPVVAISAGNACTSGMTGRSLYLMAKIGGKWKLALDVPAIAFDVLRSKKNGWAEISVGGRGFCNGIWSFNGTEYIHSKNVNSKGQACL